MSNIHSEVSQGVLRIAFDRPERRNALTQAMYSDLLVCFEEAARRPELRVVLLEGRGGAFTSGNDLHDFAAFTQQPLESLPVIKLIRYLLDFPKPIVAAVQGAAVGFGTTVLLHCDLVLAAPSARFALPFTRLGLVPEFGSSYLLAQIAGTTRASELLLLGNAFDAERAEDYGLVSMRVEEEALEEAALARAHELARLPPAALRATKSLIRGPRRTELGAAVDAEITAFAAGLASPEHAEAVQAFLEKRPADFSKFT